MEIRAILKEQCQHCSDTSIVLCYEGTKVLEQGAWLPEGHQSMLGYLVREEDFKGKIGEIQSFRLPVDQNPRNIILVGLGDCKGLSPDKIRKTLGKTLGEARKLKANAVNIRMEQLPQQPSIHDLAEMIAEVAILSDYKFDTYKENKKNDTSLQTITLVCTDHNQKLDVDAGINEGLILGETTVLTRRLVNEPANVMVPIELANQAQEASQQYGFQIDIYDETKIQELGMKAFWEVGKASENPPRLIVMRHFGDKDNPEDIVALIGKGLTYDSGGLSLKPSDGMQNMKTDMAGSAAVIGAMSAIAKLNLKKNVVAIVAACENMVSGGAYRPGDIIGSMGGKTIEIITTDAEGRLTLVDAVTYALEKEGAKKIVDIATLTGAAAMALGGVATAVVSNNDEFYNKLEVASNLSSEKIWRLPHFEEYKEFIKSDVADLKNSGGRLAGAITAALFIGEFVKDTPWLHLDIAGNSFSQKDTEYLSKGATGFGSRMLYYLVKELI